MAPAKAHMAPAIDDLDRRLLAQLQADARTSSAELARRFNLSAPGLQKRLKKLEQRGVIRQYATIVQREAVGLDLLCFVHVMLAHHRPESVKRFPSRVERMPEVLECHFLTGEFDYLMKVVLENHDHLEQFLFEKLMKVDGVDRIRTSIVIKEVKASTTLPLGNGRRPAGRTKVRRT
jgi:DNA-binding Lrp family transcriptional regulator